MWTDFDALFNKCKNETRKFVTRKNIYRTEKELMLDCEELVFNFIEKALKLNPKNKGKIYSFNTVFGWVLADFYFREQRKKERDVEIFDSISTRRSGESFIEFLDFLKRKKIDQSVFIAKSIKTCIKRLKKKGLSDSEIKENLIDISLLWKNQGGVL